MAEGYINVESLSGEIISSGSLFDIKKPGIYYLTASVTDKPIAGGGVFILGSYDNYTKSGIFVSQYTNECFYLSMSGTTLTNIYKIPVAITENFTATTTTSGAWLIPSNLSGKVIVDYYTTNMVAAIFRRDANYLGIKDYSTFAPVAEQSVSVNITYFP